MDQVIVIVGGKRLHYTATGVAAHPRRRGNRIEMLFAAVHESAFGT